MELDGGLAGNGQLHSPPDSTNAPKQDASDSELSDVEDPEDPEEEKAEKDEKVKIVNDFGIGEITPAYWADDGHVPVFMPTYEQFQDFTLYVRK